MFSSEIFDIKISNSGFNFTGLVYVDFIFEGESILVLGRVKKFFSGVYSIFLAEFSGFTFPITIFFGKII